MFGIQKGDNLQISALKIIIFISIFLSPLLFSLKDYYYFSTIKYTFLAVFGSLACGFLVSLLVSQKRTLSKQTKILLGTVSVFLVWLLVTSATGIHFESSFWSNFGRHSGFVTYLFSFVLSVSTILVYSKETIWQLLKAFVFGGVLATLTVFSSPVFLNLDIEFLRQSSNAGTFGNTTYAALFLVFSFFASLILFVREEQTKKKIIWAILALILLLNPIFIEIQKVFTLQVTSIDTFLGEARAGFVSVALGILASVSIFLSASQKKIQKLFSYALLGLFACGVVFSAFDYFSPDSKIQEYLIAGGDGARVVYWEMAWNGAMEKPLLGYGLENYSFVHNQNLDPVLLNPPYPNEPWTDKPHNAMLETLVSSGVPGLVLYLSVLGFVLVSLVRFAQNTQDRKDILTASFLVGLLVSYQFQLFFAFDTISSIQAYFVFLGVVSVFLFGGGVIKQKHDLNDYARFGLTILMIVVIMFGIYFFAMRVRAESKQIRVLTDTSLDQRPALFEKAFNTSPVGTLRSEAQFLDIIVDGYRQYWQGFNEEVKLYGEKELEVLFGYASSMSDAYPFDLRFSLVGARIAGLLSSIQSENKDRYLEKAEKFSMRTIENAPFSALGYEVMIETQILAKDYNKALEYAYTLYGLGSYNKNYADLLMSTAIQSKNVSVINDVNKKIKTFIPEYSY